MLYRIELEAQRRRQVSQPARHTVRTMVETIWSIIGVLGGLLTVGVVFYFLITGRHDRDREEEAREYFDEHGRWPDESPSG